MQIHMYKPVSLVPGLDCGPTSSHPMFSPVTGLDLLVHPIANSQPCPLQCLSHSHGCSNTCFPSLLSYSVAPLSWWLLVVLHWYIPTQYEWAPVPLVAGIQTFMHMCTEYRELLTQENRHMWSLMRRQEKTVLIWCQAWLDTCPDQPLFKCIHPLSIPFSLCFTALVPYSPNHPN